MILDNLRRKLTEREAFSEEELQYMLSNIGHEDPAIRDALIYSLFCIGFDQERFSPDQIKSIIAHLSEDDMLLGGIERDEIAFALRRSFSALVLALLLYFDDEKESKYFRMLLPDERNRIFQLGRKHISVEKDATGYLEPYGWVHTIAHASELLLSMARHSLLGAELPGDITDAIFIMFTKQQDVFKDREAKRIGLVVLEMLKTKRWPLLEFRGWIRRFAEHYKESNLTDIHSLRSKENVENMLSYIILFLDEEDAEEVWEDVKRFICLGQ